MFVLGEVDVVGDGFVEEFFIGGVELDGFAGDGEGGFAHVFAAHAGFAGGEVVAGLEREREGGGGAGGDVFLFGYDA